jgi:hypothetical protein
MVLGPHPGSRLLSGVERLCVCDLHFAESPVAFVVLLALVSRTGLNFDENLSVVGVLLKEELRKYSKGCFIRP